MKQFEVFVFFSQFIFSEFKWEHVAGPLNNLAAQLLFCSMIHARKEILWTLHYYCQRDATRIHELLPSVLSQFLPRPPGRLFQQKVFISFPRLQMWTAAYTYTEGREHLPKGKDHCTVLGSMGKQIDYPVPKTDNKMSIYPGNTHHYGNDHCKARLTV